MLQKIFGQYGGNGGYGMLYFYIAMVLGDYMIDLAKSVQGTFYEIRVCRPAAAVISCIILLLPNALRTLHGISFAAIMSNSTIIIVLVLCMLVVFQGEAEQEKIPFETPVVAGSFYDWFGAIGSFIFAF